MTMYFLRIYALSKIKTTFLIIVKFEVSEEPCNYY